MPEQRINYPTRVVEDGAEQDCGHWYSALSQGIRLAARQVDRGRIVAIGIGGHAPSPVVVDSHLQPVGPVLPWFDGRSSSQREQILQRLGHEPRDGGERLMVGLSARALWLRGRSPGQFAYARSILHSADYLIARLTGQTITSSPKAAAVLAAADLPLELIAERCCQPGEIVGQLSAGAAKQFELSTAVVVVAGGLDSFLASIGSGICQPGDACLSLGSSAIVALLSRGGPAGRFQWANCQLHSQPIRPGGSALPWARQLAAPDAKLDDLILAAADLPPSPRPAECFADWIGTGRSTDSQVQRELAELAQAPSARADSAAAGSGFSRPASGADSAGTRGGAGDADSVGRPIGEPSHGESTASRRAGPGDRSAKGHRQRRVGRGDAGGRRTGSFLTAPRRRANGQTRAHLFTARVADRAGFLSPEPQGEPT